MGHFRDHSKAGVRFKRKSFSTPSLTVVPARGLPWRQAGETKELHALVVTKMDKLKVSALLIASISVTLVLNLALSSPTLAPSPSGDVGYVIVGPEKTHSENVISDLENNVIKSIEEQVGILLVEHAFTLELSKFGNYSMFEIEKEKGGEDPTPPELIDVLWCTDVKGDINVIKWDHVSAKFVGDYEEEIFFEGDETNFMKKFSLESPLLDEVHSHSNIYIVYASTSHEWHVAGTQATRIVAYGKFYVDEGNAVVSVSNLSSYYKETAWYIWTCSFSSSKSGVGTFTAQVNTDTHMLMPAGCPIITDHFDSYPRVAVDAWLDVKHWSSGNKWLGPVHPLAWHPLVWIPILLIVFYLSRKI